jgi:hypothetical protein
MENLRQPVCRIGGAMKDEYKFWYRVFRSDGLDPIRSALLAILKAYVDRKHWNHYK